MQYVLIEKDELVTVITINRPKQLNALNPEVLKELNDAIETAENDKETRVVIITGAGEKAFIAGADIGAMKDMTAVEGQAFGKLGQKLFSKIERLRKPVIAAINGFALGGGCELALACDIRLCSENAKFGQPEVNLGIIPGFGGTQRLPKVVGKSKAMKLILTGDVIDAQEAYNLGLADQVVAVEQLMPTAIALAKKIASKPPIAIELAKAAINYCTGYADEGCDYEAALLGVCFSTSDQKEGMEAFIQKRKASFKGH